MTIQIERRPLSPGHVPTTRDGIPLDVWIIVYRGRPDGDTAAGRIRAGRLDIAAGRMATRMIAADSGRMEFAAVRHPSGSPLYILGDGDEGEALALFGVGVPAPKPEPSAVADVRALGVSKMVEVEAQMASARAKAAELGLVAADVDSAKKADLIDTFELLGLPVDKTAKVDELRASLLTVLSGV